MLFRAESSESKGFDDHIFTQKSTTSRLR